MQTKKQFSSIWSLSKLSNLLNYFLKSTDCTNAFYIQKTGHMLYQNVF